MGAVVELNLRTSVPSRMVLVLVDRGEGCVVDLVDLAPDSSLAARGEQRVPAVVAQLERWDGLRLPNQSRTPEQVMLVLPSK